MLERLSAPAPDAPVPVLLPAVTWDPLAEGLKTWIERQLRENYPGPGSLTIDDVLPVVDGVDELNPKRRERALACLNAAIGQGHRLVLTCRSQEYAEANAFPAGFDVLELEPLSACQVASFLRDHLPASALPLWEPIFETLRDDPDGEFAAMCSSPFMLTMLLRAYGPGGMGRDPAELLAPAQGEAHATALISGYVFSLGRSSSYPAERLTAWLGSVAAHLDRLGTSGFAWWRLDLVLRPATRLAAVGVLWLAHLAVAFVMTGTSVVDLLVPASATAVVLARGTLITPRSPAPRRLYTARSFAGSMRSQAWRALLTVVVSARASWGSRRDGG
ncbi:hypothetical protein AB0M50_24790 [Nonomuraea fuscirosea]|uniref:hypothetical protein n=1 Tax=Nonomuraea fuscirosea TaxID=1291556 RepID=UPI003432A18D